MALRVKEVESSAQLRMEGSRICIVSRGGKQERHMKIGNGEASLYIPLMSIILSEASV